MPPVLFLAPGRDLPLRAGKRPETAFHGAAGFRRRQWVPSEPGLPGFAGYEGKGVTQYACPPGRHTAVPE